MCDYKSRYMQFSDDLINSIEFEDVLPGWDDKLVMIPLQSFYPLFGVSEGNKQMLLQLIEVVVDHVLDDVESTNAVADWVPLCQEILRKYSISKDAKILGWRSDRLAFVSKSMGGNSYEY